MREEAVIYLTVPEVIEIHAQAMESMDTNPAPLRSEDLLHSAVMRPQAVAYYGSADLVEQACVLAVGISQNQPFLDGNKRTAFAAMITFLDVIGLGLRAESVEVARRLIAVAEREGTLEDAINSFAEWLRERVCPTTESTETAEERYLVPPLPVISAAIADCPRTFAQRSAVP